MKTQVITASMNPVVESEYEIPAGILKEGGLVAFPTETVYGLGGDGLRPEASKKIYQAKGRPSDNPLILHIGTTDKMELLAKDIPERAWQLARKFWPGPLTMVLKKAEIVPYETTGGLDTVALRMPNHPVALALLKTSDICIAAPSANTSGRPSPTKAEHVIEDMNGKIDCILDGGMVGIGIESTIVDLTGEVPMILRPGFITAQMLSEVIGEVVYDPAVLAQSPDENLKPKAPGMKYRHYAPKGELIIYEGTVDKVAEKINELAQKSCMEGKKVGILATEETCHLYQNGVVKTIGRREEEASIARGLYDVLRSFDEENVEVIFGESFSEGELGQAIMNRLLKAAGYHIEKV